MPKSTSKSSSKSSGGKGERRQKKDPNAPKRGMSAYIIFSNDMREKVKAENPNISFGDIAKEISERWKNIDAATKQKYEARSKADKSRYEREIANYAPQTSSSKSKKSKQQAPPSDEDED